jgi:hypothetical protein
MTSTDRSIQRIVNHSIHRISVREKEFIRVMQDVWISNWIENVVFLLVEPDSHCTTIRWTLWEEIPLSMREINNNFPLHQQLVLIQNVLKHLFVILPFTKIRSNMILLQWCTNFFLIGRDKSNFVAISLLLFLMWCLRVLYGILYFLSKKATDTPPHQYSSTTEKSLGKFSELSRFVICFWKVGGFIKCVNLLWTKNEWTNPNHCNNPF